MTRTPSLEAEILLTDLSPSDGVLHIDDATPLLKPEAFDDGLCCGSTLEHAQQQVTVWHQRRHRKPGDLLEKTGRRGNPAEKIPAPFRRGEHRCGRLVYLRRSDGDRK